MENKLIKLLHSLSGFEVKYINGVLLGYLEPGDDGYYYYWPTNRPGYWASEVMREIADTLDDLNKKWDKRIKKALG